MTEKNDTRPTADERLRGAVGNAIDELHTIEGYIGTLSYAIDGLDAVSMSGKGLPFAYVIGDLWQRVKELREMLDRSFDADQSGEGAA